MPRIENDIKLDFKDVLLRPKRTPSSLGARYLHLYFIKLLLIK
ncbi:unnamed protein product [Tetraodon nigroviridis]|uniref:(spotted green pufferfish) hypothetical protein n=1 Tax=Tetraodon nigroviridis TaxID=99883 RepID=Q4S0S0_TETNG|nr:unnamed protein product [Tetraodon nigroviridis]